MIAVLVGNQQGTEVCNAQSKARQSPLGFTAGKTTVDHDPRGTRLNQRGIATTTTAQ
jgi:hypothetical protein